MTIILYLLLTTALYYLGSRADITEALWSRYPERFDKFMLCPACSGFWYGLACGGLGWWRDWSFLGLNGRSALTLFLIALCSIVWTPLLSYLHLTTMRRMDNDNDYAAREEGER